MNGHEFDTAELAVDASDEFIDGRTKVLVFFHVSSGRDCYLNQDHLAISGCETGERDLSTPFGVLSEEDFKGVEFLRDSLDVIESIDTDNNLLALELLFKFRNTFLTFRILDFLIPLTNHDGRGGGDTSVNFSGSMPIGIVATFTVLPLYCTALGMVDKFNTRLQADKKCRA